MNSHLAKTIVAAAGAVFLLTTLMLAPVTSLRAADTTKPVKVFILAGQSNMNVSIPEDAWATDKESLAVPESSEWRLKL